MGPSATKITAVIVTWRRPDWLERCVRSLLEAAAAAPVDLEVRVGVNGPDAASLAVAERLRESAARVAEPRGIAPALSPAAARNLMLAEAPSAGEWILFIDDDAYVGADYFQAFLRARAAWPDAAVIGGPNLTPPGSSPLARAAGAVLASRLATYLSVSRYRRRGRTRPCGEESLILCNLFARRDRLPPAPFPPDFFCGEENWMMQTVAASGGRLVHAPDLGVWHERRARLAPLARQIFAYGSGRGRNLRRRPRTVRLPHVLPSACLLYGALAVPIALARGGPAISWAAAPVAAYGVLVAATAWRARRAAGAAPAWLWMPPLFLLVHVAYGAGVIAGALRR
jgi:glycosyltransferase involved in cell wall biosynthesis